MRHLLAIVLLMSPIRSGHEVGVRLRAEIQEDNRVLYDSTGDGVRDSWRRWCSYSITADGTLTAVCPPLDD